MYIQQLYTNCLSQAAYYIESGREAIIIDPLRDPKPYLDLAKARGASIRYIFETHFHADFVSGHLDLAHATKAEIVFGPLAQPSYPAYVAADGEVFVLGNIRIRVLHTPGHTIESSCFLLYDESGEAFALFSGDTLFDGEVGRPDLLSANLDAATLAGMLYDSLQNKIKPLADQVLVYPGHGPGSACGKNIGKDTETTIGKQRRSNYALKDMSREAFVKLITSGLPVPPSYFFSDAALNKKGTVEFNEVLQQALHFISPAEADRMKHEGSVLLDSRSSEAFAAAHIPGSVNIGLNGSFANWAGTLFPVTTSFVLITESGKEEETITRLARIGYDQVRGILKDGIIAWQLSGRPLESLACLQPAELEEKLQQEKFVLLDVRQPAELQQQKIAHSINIPLNELRERTGRLDPSRSYAVICAGGYRSVIAASLLKAAGIADVYNVPGGISFISKEKPALLEKIPA